ncbi:hypothetical protein [Candidatus Methylacidithermus pantelleriae]|uniref:Uncharacterized protein n=1 Tax=Candidatus Methylacidithermus pantelleriae TaxID=2744239 RepID=A0A8J2BT98_9BACT|nr:hypothetical protein [Candidatus Methylacidithermus pantelleriae]CAF0698647.1 hypothetical protein MPNT_290013 [Candidatus Methylacidithermus pantelleriae]
MATSFFEREKVFAVAEDAVEEGGSQSPKRGTEREERVGEKRAVAQENLYQRETNPKTSPNIL